MADFSSEEWRRVSPLVDELLELDPAAQAARLERELADRPRLRERVARLLNADRLAADFLGPLSGEVIAEIVSELASGEPVPSPERTPGARIGVWRVVKEIGQGGMGSVYLAERDDAQYRQRVALKLIRGGIAGREARARFLRERQILADLQHRNIARLLDGGSTADGVPYLVMEYVEGRPIDRYCDDASLPVRERLALFEQVCEAVQYAHGRLVVHRDLKPGNILVTDDGRVKLLDFGVAKLLGSDVLAASGPATRTGVRLLTPEFASPEQLAGRTVTVASDVYELGVLLYLLLSGRLPYEGDGATPAELERRIASQAPEKPSATTEGALRRRLRGDLDNIVLKALRAEPERRYPSVSALLEDIRRHGAGLPVSARPATLRYRLRLLGRRHRVALVATGLVILALVTGLAGTIWQARAASIEARKAAQVSEFVIGLFEVVDPARSRGDSVTTRELLERGAERVDRELGDQPLVQAQMTHVLGRIYWKLSQLDRAEVMLRRALALRVAERGPNSLESAESLTSLGAVTMLQGRYAEADSLLDAALVILEKRTRAGDLRRADALAHRAVSARHQNDLARAEALHREALALRRAASPETTPDIAGSLKDLALVLHTMNRFDEAEATYREALDLMIGLHGERHPDVGTTLHSLAALLSTLGRLEEAQAMAERSLAVQAAVHGPRHRLVANALDALANITDQRGDLARATELHTEALTIKRELLGDAHPSVATSLNNLALALRDQNRLDEAESRFRDAHAIYRARFGDRHPFVAVALLNLGSVALRKGNRAAARGLYEEALDVLRETSTGHSIYVSNALVGLGETLLALEEAGRAETALREALAIREQLLPSPHWRLAEARTLLARALVAQDRYAEAEPIALAAVGSVLESGSRLDAEQSRRARAALELARRGPD
jgi:serine/threonine-protein kinase